MRSIAILNQKGGVGKTTTAANTAAALAMKGLRVLVADLDPQAHLTIHFGLDPERIEAGAYKVLTQEAQVRDEVVNVRENIDILAANIDLVGAESELVSVVGREIILKQGIDKVRNDYDYFIIDCAPSLGLLTLNALAAADEILIPLQPHFLALQGLGKLLQTVELVNKRINPNLRVTGILLCMFDTRASLPNEVKADIQSFLKAARGSNVPWSQAQVFPVFIRRNIKLAEAPSYGQTIFEYESECNGAEDYAKVADLLHKDHQVSDKAKQDDTDVSDTQAQQQPEPDESPRQGDEQPDSDIQSYQHDSDDAQAASEHEPGGVIESFEQLRDKGFTVN